jgi:hypothetical protein
MKYSMEEHNARVEKLPLASHIKLSFLLCKKEIARLEERRTELVTYQLSTIAKYPRDMQSSLHQWSRDYDALTDEIRRCEHTMHIMSHMLDKYDLWGDTSNTWEELEDFT